VSGDKDHTVADQLPGGGDRLLGITEVVRRDELHLLPEYPARGVEVGYGQLRPALHLLTEPAVLSRNRARHPDQDVPPSRPAERGGKYDHN
jgi:hypothetical protein